MDQQLDIAILAQELGMRDITIMQLRAENEALKKRLAAIEEDE